MSLLLSIARTATPRHLTMKLSPLAILAVSVGATSAFSTASRFAVRAPARPLAAALFSVSTDVSGEEATASFRLNFKSDGSAISPWHDIHLKSDSGAYNMVVEIPKMSKAKMEVATKEENNPIAQDIKKGNLRDYHGPIFWNYGCLPQTWEDPNGEENNVFSFVLLDLMIIFAAGAPICLGFLMHLFFRFLQVT